MEQPINEKDGFEFLGIGATWGEEGTQIDESQTYNIYNPESATAKILRILEQNPKLIYYIVGAVAALVVGFLIYKKKKKKA
jgi:LPXTG-motif cell wall-anchored protein